MASASYNEARESTATVAVWCVLIVFPTFFDLETKEFKWSTVDEIELEDGRTYAKFLTEPPTGRHQRDRGGEYCSFTVANPNNSTYQELYPYEDIIEKAEVTVFECYEIDKGLFESEKRFVGYLKDFTLDDGAKTLNFTCDSDMSRAGFFVGNRQLTRERCGADFNYDGLAAPNAPRPCTWQLAQGGNPDYCSKYRKGVDGCASHNNEHQFYAIEGLSKATVQFVEGSGGYGSGGFDYETQGCFTEKTFVLMADWTIKRISEIEKDDLVMSFDIFDNDRLVEGIVLSAEKYDVEEFNRVDFEDGLQLEVSKRHLFYIGYANFAPVGILTGRRVKGIDKDEKPLLNRITAQEAVCQDTFVYNHHNSVGTYFVTDEKGETFIMVHNRKSLTPMLVN